MPDISKINALAIGSVAKVDGLAKASILDIDGVAVPSAVVGPAPSVAFSLRQLPTSYGLNLYSGPVVRVRRETAGGTGDDDEADVAFDTSLTTPAISLDSAISNPSAGVTATTLGQFLNVGTVNGTTYTNPDSLTGTAESLIVTWKDQSSNSYHASNSTQAQQPQIHSGLASTDLNQEGGKPCIQFKSTGSRLFFSTVTTTTYALLSVSKATSSGIQYLMGEDTAATTIDLTVRTINGAWQLNYCGPEIYYCNTAGDRIANMNGSDVDNTRPTCTAQNILYQTCTSYWQRNLRSICSTHLNRYWRGTMQELVFYNSVIADNYSTVANSYYSVY